VRVEGEWAFSEDWLSDVQDGVVQRLELRASASPLDPGLALAELLPPEPWASAVLPLLAVDRRGGRRTPGAPSWVSAAARQLERALSTPAAPR
jgi:hypothetical protein